MRAWLTPDESDLEEAQVCRQISVPVPLLPYVNGALELLAKSENWEAYGDATPEQMAQAFMGIIDETAVSECGGGGGGEMQWITANSMLVKSGEDSEVVDLVIESADLPAGASNATGLYCRVVIMGEEPGVYININYLQPAGHTHAAESSSQAEFYVIMPFVNGEVTVQGVNDGDVGVEVYLIGWW